MPWLHQQFNHLSGTGHGHVQFHLHGFHHQQCLVGVDLLTNFSTQLPNIAGDMAFDHELTVRQIQLQLIFFLCTVRGIFKAQQSVFTPVVKLGIECGIPRLDKIVDLRLVGGDKCIVILEGKPCLDRKSVV